MIDKLKMYECVEDIIKTLDNKEEVEEFLGEIVHNLNVEGFFLSGSITIDDRRTCPNCGYQMRMIVKLDKSVETECPKCIAAVAEAIKTNPMAEYNPAMDSKICSTCGNLAVRTGNCYTCVDCGTNEGCG